MALLCSNTNDFIKNLIDNSSDLQSNLFDVTLTPKEGNASEAMKNFSFRVKSFNAPALKLSTVSLPFNNTTVPITVPSHDDAKQITFEVRLDDAFALYDYLRSNMSIDVNGNFNKKNPIDIEVNTFNFKDTEINRTHTWKFSNCECIEFPQLQFTYESASAQSVTIPFIYRTYSEE